MASDLNRYNLTRRLYLCVQNLFFVSPTFLFKTLCKWSYLGQKELELCELFIHAPDLLCESDSASLQSPGFCSALRDYCLWTLVHLNITEAKHEPHTLFCLHHSVIRETENLKGWCRLTVIILWLESLFRNHFTSVTLAH